MHYLLFCKSNMRKLKIKHVAFHLTWGKDVLPPQFKMLYHFPDARCAKHTKLRCIWYFFKRLCILTWGKMEMALHSYVLQLTNKCLAFDHTCGMHFF